MKISKDMVRRARQLSAEFRTDKQIYEALDIDRSTFYAWKSRGRNGSGRGIYAEFVEALEDGHAEFLDNVEHNCLAKVIEAHSWQSDAWILERLFPEKYARTNIRPYTSGDNMVDSAQHILVQIEQAAEVSGNGKGQNSDPNSETS